ncbi:transporter substrate-binding domain-containing protein [Streptomyces sp. NPDC054796]
MHRRTAPGDGASSGQRSRRPLRRPSQQRGRGRRRGLRHIRADAPAVTLPLVLVLGLALVASCASGESGQFLGTSRVTVAMHNDLPGISYSENYDRSGFDHLLHERIEKAMGVSFSEPVDVSSADRISQLEHGDADMVIASFSITPDRMRRIDFAGPYLKTRQGFLVDEDRPRSGGIEELKDLRGKTVCTWDGTTSETALAEVRTATGVTPQVLDDASDCIEELKKGTVDAVTTDQLILYGFARHHAKDGLRVVADLTIGAPQHYGIGLRKGFREDCRRLADWLKEYVGTSEWIRDVETSLPQLPAQDPGWISTHKPSTAAIDSRSCRDRPSP